MHLLLLNRLRLPLLAILAIASACATNGRKVTVHKDFPDRMAELAAGNSPDQQIAKQLVPPDSAQPGQRGPLKPGEPIWIQAGKSRVLQLSHPVKRVSIGDPDRAGIVILGPQTIMLNAKPLPAKQITEEDKFGDLRAGRLGTIANRTLTPEPHVAETSLVLWDGVDSQYDAHTLFIADFIAQQVMLDVTVAELDRTAMEEHGIDFRQIGTSFVSAYFMGGGLGPKAIGSVPPEVARPFLPLAGADGAPQYIFQLPHEDITAFIKLLQVEGLATILAQPQIMALSGQNAVFQVGGEIPIRIVTGFTSDVQFKPFGTLVNFVPRVSEEGDILLTVTPEVSEPDFNSPVEGIPTFRTRRASTATRLRNGETLVIGGLKQEARIEQVSGVPYLMNLPLVGYIFRDTSYKSTVQELMVVVTPHLVHPLSPGSEVSMPTDRGPLTEGEIRTQRNPAETTRPRIPGLP